MIRVFPRKTKWTPDDELAFVGDPPLFRPSDNQAVYISVAFSWDIQEGLRLKKSWKRFYSWKRFIQWDFFRLANFIKVRKEKNIPRNGEN